MSSLVDLKNHNLNYKIREHSLAKVPVLLICGKKEVDSNSVTIRRLDSNKQENMELNIFLKKWNTSYCAPFAFIVMKVKVALSRKDAPSNNSAVSTWYAWFLYPKLWIYLQRFVFICIQSAYLGSLQIHTYNMAITSLMHKITLHNIDTVNIYIYICLYPSISIAHQK